jgi:hypothetical protein
LARLGGYRYQSDDDVEITVRRRLSEEDAGSTNKEQENPFHVTGVSIYVETVEK